MSNQVGFAITEGQIDSSCRLPSPPRSARTPGADRRIMMTGPLGRATGGARGLDAALPQLSPPGATTAHALRWHNQSFHQPSSSSPSAAADAEKVQRRIALSRSGGTGVGVVGAAPPPSIVGTVLSMIKRCGADSAEYKQLVEEEGARADEANERLSHHHHHHHPQQDGLSNNAGVSSAVGAGRGNVKAAHAGADHQHHQRKTAAAPDSPSSPVGVDPSQTTAATRAAQRRLPQAGSRHRPAQRDFIDWAPGAAGSLDNFASVNRWVEWALQEADYHAARLTREGARAAGAATDALDLAELMRANFDELLVDAAAYYDDIRQRAEKINACVRAWSRHPTAPAAGDASPSDSPRDGALASPTTTGAAATAAAAGVANESFLVRTSFLVLDRVLSHSTLMRQAWPRLRNGLMRGLFVHGDRTLAAAAAAAGSNGKDATSVDAAQLCGDALVIEQYDELLAQFRDSERQRFHLESSTTQLSAYSDMAAKHDGRKLVRVVFRAWRSAAREAKAHERLLVHFARQCKAKETCGRYLHRWRSYMQLQRRMRAVRLADETRRMLSHATSQHEATVRDMRTAHERAVSGYEIKLLHTQQQYESAVDAALLERTTLEAAIASLREQVQRSRLEAQQWRTAALLSRPSEGQDAVAIHQDDAMQRQAVLEMSLALQPPSRRLQQLVSVVRGTEDALYLAMMRTAETAAAQTAAKTAAARRAVDGAGGLASPTASSLAKSMTATNASFLNNTLVTTVGDPASRSTAGGFEWGKLPAMDYLDTTAQAAAAAATSSAAGGMPRVPRVTMFAEEAERFREASPMASTLRSASTGALLLGKQQLNFQALAAAAREAIQAFLVEWVNEMLSRAVGGRSVMHAGVQRNASGATVARSIKNLNTDLYDGSVYMSLCKAVMPPEHQRRGETDVFSTLVSTMFVYTAHGLTPPLIVHCPFYRRFFRADTFGTFIHPTAGLWIVASLFCGYALRTAQNPTYRSHPALAPVHQYSPSGRHRVAKTARNQAVTRPPLNVLIMSGVNTCGYGTKKAATASGPRGDAAMLQRLGVVLDKTLNANPMEGASASGRRSNAATKASDVARHTDLGDDDYHHDHDHDDDDGNDDDDDRSSQISGADSDGFFGNSLNSDDDVAQVVDDAQLPGERARRQQQQQQRQMDAWLNTPEAVEAAQKAVPETLRSYGPTELLLYWQNSQENRSIWVGMSRVITSLAVRFRVFDVDTKRSEQNTTRRHMQSYMTSNLTSEIKIDSTASPTNQSAS